MSRARADRRSTPHALAPRPDAGAIKALENSYRIELGLVDSVLEEGSYATLVARMVNGAGGDLNASVQSQGMIHIINRRCPFVRRSCADVTDLCQTALGIFGSIAARNFGYAKIAVDRLITRTGDSCGFCIYLCAEQARNVPGTEYDRLGCQAVPEPATARCVIARSPAMQHVLAAARCVAPTSATVLITGQTGTGKELVARTVHANSVRTHGEFLGVNCGAIPDALIESTLFGHERGAFTGATTIHHGLFERAQDGTLFLDEVNALSATAQTRLLRVLQEGEYERLGGHEVLHTNARIIAATNRPLDQAIEAGDFLSDLYYRINVINIHIPPLRERPEDIPALVEHILDRLSAKYHKPKLPVTEGVMKQLLVRDWPGNVRELENVLERSFLFSPGPALDRLLIDAADLATCEAPGTESGQGWKDRRRRAIETEERLYLVESLSRHHGSIQRVAADMGLTTRAVYMKLRSYGLKPADYRN